MKTNILRNIRVLAIQMICLTVLGVGQMWGVTFTKVTDVANLSSGDEIIIVSEYASKALSTTQNNNNRAATAVTISSSEITDPEDVEVITLGTSNGNWTFYAPTPGGTAGYLYAASSSKNYLRTQASNDANGEWTISISNGDATIIAQGSNTRNQMQYNKTNILFSCYDGTQTDGALQIYKKGASTFTATLAVNTAGYGTVSPTSVGSLASGATITKGTGANINKITIGGTTVTATPHAQDADYNYAFSSWTVPGNVTTVTADIIITANFTRTARTYKNYRTVCCANMVDAPTVSATDIHAHQFTLTWTNVTGADGYTVTCAGGTPGAVQSSSTTRTCTITGLASANTAYSWSVVATYSGSYCGATPANGSTTTAQEYSVSYNANGGTVTTLPASANYEAGVTVTVAAKPATTTKSGYTFTGWNTANDGSGTHYDATGSATFTMPSSAVVLYAEWTTKKNYYVDRMHGTNDGHTVTIGGVVYNCYLREAAYTVPTISDNTSGATTCHNEHDHLLFWVTASSVNDDGTLKNSYTEVTPGSAKTATTDGTIYYAIWGKLAD